MRIRTVKPEFFLHEGLYDLEVETALPIRVAFVGLWCAADREGRFVWSERRLKASILPYDNVDFSRVLHALATRGFVVKYASNGEWFGVIPSFKKHQVINNKERASDLPEVTTPEQVDALVTREPRDEHACHKEGKGKEGKGRERNEVVGVSPTLSLPLGDQPRRKPKAIKSQKPESVEECLLVGAKLGMTEAECRAWFLEMEVCEWRDTKGVPFGNWKAKMMWHRKESEKPRHGGFGKAPNGNHHTHPNDRNIGGGDTWDATAPGGEDDVPV